MDNEKQPLRDRLQVLVATEEERLTTRPLSARYLQAMRADSVPTGKAGLWFIYKLRLHEATASVRDGQAVVCPPGTYTYLKRLTTGTMHQEPPGVVVMEDTPFELQSHLDFVMRACGRVLVTGLGLGCVVRGLLINPAVTHVTCIENSADVLKLVRPYMPGERLTVIQADALTWTKESGEVFDCAYHDLWTNREEGEPHLAEWHAQCLFNCARRVTMQGAWGFPREFKRLLQAAGVNVR